MISAMDNTVSGYPLHPVKGASSAFAILFSIACVLHIYQNFKYKSWSLLWLLPCTCIISIAGFICLEYNAFHPTAYAPSQGLLYSAVVLLTAYIYLGLLQLMYLKAVLPRQWDWIVKGILMLLFTAVLSLTSQGTSNFFSPGSSPSLMRSDHAVLKAGIILLLVFNIVFFGILAAFHRSCSRAAAFAESANRNIKLFIVLLYTIAMLLLARNIFRTVQIFSPSDSPAWRVQTFFWVFDASPLLISTVLLNAFHPGKLVQSTPCSS